MRCLSSVWNNYFVLNCTFRRSDSHPCIAISHCCAIEINKYQLRTRQTIAILRPRGSCYFGGHRQKKKKGNNQLNEKTRARRMKRKAPSVTFRWLCNFSITHTAGAVDGTTSTLYHQLAFSSTIVQCCSPTRPSNAILLHHRRCLR